jgi:hypothetical protein
MAVPSYVSKSQALSSGGVVGSLSVAAPSSSGGMLLAVISAFRAASAITITAPSGWTQVNQTNNGLGTTVGIFTRTDDTGTPWTFSFSENTSQGAQGHIFRYADADSAQLIDGTISNSTGLPADGALTVPSVSTSFRDARIVSGLTQRASPVTLTVPSGFTERVNVTHATGTGTNGVTFALGDREQQAIGVTGTATFGSDGTSNIVGFQLALKSASPSVNNSSHYHQQQAAAI